jgi:hypothetical protein
MTKGPGANMNNVPTYRAYWWNKLPNFGDALAPLLLERFCKINIVRGDFPATDIVSIGSVLEHIPEGWNGFVLGSGRLKESSKLHIDEARILSIRGPLSAADIKGNFSIGDPGLLADELVGPQEKIYDLGVVPHWRDTELASRFISMFRDKFKNTKSIIKVINPADDPLTVVRQIGSCKRIVTSSLHGMITADAFGIPRRVELCPGHFNQHEGGDFKFRDYSASLGLSFEPGVMFQPSRRVVEDVKYAVFDAYQGLEEALLDGTNSGH